MSPSISICSTPVALSIAGSDCSGGAGIQADLKTFSALGVYGASVISAITAQNTLGVQGACGVEAKWVKAQLQSVLSDLKVGAIKTGMLFDEKIIAVIAKELAASKIPLVVDPVMVATSGQRLLSKSAETMLQKLLLPLAYLITPNLQEAAVLLKCKPAQNIEEMQQQACLLLEQGCKAVLLKGGHLAEKHSADVFASKKIKKIIAYEKTNTPNTHGTGCTLSAAIAAYLSQGADLVLAVTMAHEYVQEAIMQADDLKISKKTSVKNRHGPVHHFYRHW